MPTTCSYLLQFLDSRNACISEFGSTSCSFTCSYRNVEKFPISLKGGRQEKHDTASLGYPQTPDFVFSLQRKMLTWCKTNNSQTQVYHVCLDVIPWTRDNKKNSKGTPIPIKWPPPISMRVDTLNSGSTRYTCGLYRVLLVSSCIRTGEPALLSCNLKEHKLWYIIQNLWHK